MAAAYHHRIQRLGTFSCGGLGGRGLRCAGAGLGGDFLLQARDLGLELGDRAAVGSAGRGGCKQGQRRDDARQGRAAERE